MGGLYFLVDNINFKIIEPALNFMEHYGIGANASKGLGHFSISVEDFKLSDPQEPNVNINLSQFVPKKDEIIRFKESPQKLLYTLGQKEGKLSTKHNFTSNYQKERVTYIKAGSIFPNINKSKYGRLVNVAKIDDYTIKFNGFSFLYLQI